MMNKLKVGIAIDSMLLPAWAVKVIEAIVASGHSELSLVVLCPKSRASPVSFLYSLYKKRDKKKPLNAPDAFEQQDITKIVKDVPVLHKDAKAGQARLDVLLDLCGVTTDPDVMSLSKNGIWRNFFGEARATEVPAVWEVLERRPVIASGVEVISGNGETRIVYQSYALTDPSSAKKSRNRYYWKSVSFVPRMLQVLYDSPEQFAAISLPSKGSSESKYLQAPSNVSFLSIVAGVTWNRMVNKIKRLGTRRDWILMYDTNSYEGKDVVAAEFKKIEAPAGYFWADPVVIQQNEKYYLFVEEYVYSEGKGRISVIEMDADGECKKAIPILEKPYHLSYPFVFEKDRTYYMIPESSENKTIELYECTEFPYKWTFRRNLMENVTAADTTVLFHNDKWWLFTTIEEYPGAGLLDELYLYYTDDIINSELKSHLRNPIVSDVRSARGAGPIFKKNGELYRPSQICAPYYGWGISINRVTALSERDYSEEQVSVVAPAEGENIAGVHTISYVGKVCVIDALVDMKK